MVIVMIMTVWSITACSSNDNGTDNNSTSDGGVASELGSDLDDIGDDLNPDKHTGNNGTNNNNTENHSTDNNKTGNNITGNNGLNNNDTNNNMGR